jgi:NAD(P)H-hydrate epimerase
MTVTLGAPKLPLVLPPAEALAGSLVIADIGIPEAVIDDVDGPHVEILTRESMRPLIEPRSPDSHKGDFGRVLIVAGSPGKTGAASLAAMAALRSGAGLVTVAAPASSAPVIATLGAEYMTLPLPEAPTARSPRRRSSHPRGGRRRDCRGPWARPLRNRDGGRARHCRACRHVVVLDADGINAFAGAAEALVGRDGTDLIITPHPGEMARLVGLSTEAVQANRLDVARDFATSHRVHVVLKGYRTVVVSPDGRTSINLTGNAGMATGGTGDVLTGMIAAWFGQLLDAEAATRLRVYLHGLAGDLSEADEGEVALIAGDIVARLGDAVLDLTARRRKPPSAAQS